MLSPLFAAKIAFLFWKRSAVRSAERKMKHINEPGVSMSWKKNTKVRIHCFICCIWFTDHDHIGTVINNIVSYLSKYHSFINQQKRDGATIIGYVRKSPGNEEEETRLRLLKAMIHNLKDRSLVEKIYVSPSSKSSERMIDRDSTTKEPINGSDGRMTGKPNGKFEREKA